VLAIKALFAKLATSDFAVAWLRRAFLRSKGTIFTLHRFTAEESESDAMSAACLHEAISALTNLGFRFVPLSEMIEKAQRGELKPRSIAWTVDDGYADFAEVAMPVFERHECPVTVFLVTGFVDGASWPWWDQISYIFGNAGLPSEQADKKIAALKRLPDGQKWAEIRSLSDTHCVPLPHLAPPNYRPISWDQVRACALRGASFGPHTVNHPILPTVGDRKADEEIVLSWRRLKEEVGDNALPVLAYPNGDYGPREIAFAKKAGLEAALTTRGGHIDRQAVCDRPFELPRFDLRPEPTALRQIVSGLEAAKSRWRGH
jgi:peptidoglycan/xylan/chitin deacetylase (PgdA/CDA1 family)